MNCGRISGALRAVESSVRVVNVSSELHINGCSLGVSNRRPWIVKWNTTCARGLVSRRSDCRLKASKHFQASG